MKRRFVQMQEKEAFDRFVINGAGTLVAILAVNGRKREAIEMADGAKESSTPRNANGPRAGARRPCVPPRFSPPGRRRRR